MGDTPKIPEWLEAYRQPGHEIKKIKGNYYLYERRTEWDPETKRSKKVSGSYRGKLTPEGIVPPKHLRPHAPRLSTTRPRALEYGASQFVLQAGGPAEKGGTVYDALSARGCTLDEARTIYLAAILELCGIAPNRFVEAFERSYLSVEYPRADFSALCETAAAKTSDAASLTTPLDNLSTPGRPQEQDGRLVEQVAQELRPLVAKALLGIEELREARVDAALFDLAGIARVYYAGAWHTLASSTRAAKLCRALGWDFEN